MAPILAHANNVVASSLVLNRKVETRSPFPTPAAVNALAQRCTSSHHSPYVQR